jgi:hypothetical protein
MPAGDASIQGLVSQSLFQSDRCGHFGPYFTVEDEPIDSRSRLPLRCASGSSAVVHCTATGEDPMPVVWRPRMMMMSYDGLPTPDTCRLLLRPGSNMNWERVLPPAGISISGNVKRGIYFFCSVEFSSRNIFYF